MNRVRLLPLIVLMLVSCHSLPAITPNGEIPTNIEAACTAVFPRQAWHMVHTIKTDFPGGRKGVMLGVVSLDPEGNTVECALLSIEGLRLFEAHDDGTLTTRRALPPFDRPALAEGMMQDIRLIFFRPETPPLLSGHIPSGEPGCRYALEDGIEDIVRKPSGETVIHRYDGKNRLIRRVSITRCHPDGTAGQEAVPCRIILEAFHPASYQLELDLVEARPTVDSPQNAY
jgi:hypothetical protein